MPGAPWVVLKFGGSSVTGLDRWQTIAQVLRSTLEEGVRPLVVCSALSGVTTLLETLLSEALTGHGEPVLDQIRALHQAQADALGVPLAPAEPYLADLANFVRGVGLLGEVSPRLRARTLSAGELMSTQLGVAWLKTQQIPVAWQDARDLLRAQRDPNLERRYGQAQVAFARDPAVQDVLDGLEPEVVVTQGFIAREPQGDTVLLGRGGSDTSAAVLAGKLGAQRLEIWTDVPGMFTANPREVPSARLLKRLDYNEAQELATMGAKVLHPRCIAPARAQGIPVHIRSTVAPELAGTVIHARDQADTPQVKAVAMRAGVPLVTMDTLGMWQQAGFLADAFAVFKTHGVSIDLIATSETNVTVSLDPGDAGLTPDVLDALVSDLGAICRAQLLQDNAVISLVGRRIRATLHRLGPVLERFEDQRVHLLSQAASDLNLSFVVPQARAEALVRDLHAALFGRVLADDTFGPTWDELNAPAKPSGIAAPWWRSRQAQLLELAGQGTPAYVYDAAGIDASAQALLDLAPVDRVFFAIKANPHPQVLQRLARLGLGFECVSPGELSRVRDVVGELPSDRLLFTPNFAPPSEYQFGYDAGATVTLDALHPLLHHPEVFRGRSVFVRVDPGRGAGHHRFVITAGAQSKFGVPPAHWEQLLDLVRTHDVRVEGLHCHAGSGILNPDSWAEKGALLADLARELPSVHTLDLGGGLGVPDRPGRPGLDLAALEASLSRFKALHPDLKLWLEPGRYLVATNGVLLARVNQVKEKGERTYVGVDAGMQTLIRPPLYGAWHPIHNLSRLGQEPAVVADVVGPICETGDVLGHDRWLPTTAEGDVLLIDVAGAYGASMSSRYNLRDLPREIVLDESRLPE
jgi:diaminopimelate decarboxylase/aspartate kinase